MTEIPLTFWLQLTAGAALVAAVAALWGAARVNRAAAAARDDSERVEEQVREQERAMQRVLADTRQALVQQIAYLRQTEQRAILLSTSRLYQAIERRFGEMQGASAKDAGDLRAELTQRFEALRRVTDQELAQGRLSLEQALGGLREAVDAGFGRQRESFEQRHGEATTLQQAALRDGVENLHRLVTEALSTHARDLGDRVGALTTATEQRLREIGGLVDRRLADGFEKTTETFGRVLGHLARIDEAQKRITELSSNVVSLREILGDKRSRGAFGEAQLAALVRNLLPEGSFSLQHTLSNGTRVDCLLRLPEPTGNVPIDAKFPLESYRTMTDADTAEADRQRAVQRFRADVRRHVEDIASKYVLPGETTDGAVMFIPAEAVFAEIHARFPELVEEAQRRRVWMVSPTTLMAILTTALAVLKDEATRRQVHVIREHLRDLAKDFERFQQRMDGLARHIAQAQQDVEQVAVSARRITGRFDRIEKVELEGPVPVPEEPGA
ncbi:MAG: DNA recombination protein RmuC [Gammaproteobacteria bacterium]|jgi:DNA recombination protein RmuC|nr:DNA recombination protein RmuC [Gammaproteobacteria bacterium]